MRRTNLTIKAKIYFILLIVFTILTFVGAIFVISNNGEPNAGYACIPMIFGLIFGMVFHNEMGKK